MSYPDTPNAAPGPGLDPQDWSALRALGHRMLDDLIDGLAGLDAQPVWQPLPEDVRTAWRQEALPQQPTAPEVLYRAFQDVIAPYGVGNRHPRFFGWVQGGGNPVGMLAELLAAGLNANCGGRNHAPIDIERQVIRWAAEMVGLPGDSSGLLVTGSSLANFIAVLVARTRALGERVREDGLAGAPLVAYAPQTAHHCVARAMEMAGLGRAALRLIPVDAAHRVELSALESAIVADRAAGRLPFLVVASAGTVDVGAVDDLGAVAEVCHTAGLWFHVDAAFGAMARLSSRHRTLLTGIEAADSVAFDFHKWLQVPYDAGCIVVRHAEWHARTFASQPAYLQREHAGIAAGQPWPTDFGPDLSRGFRALKVWMTLKAYGAAHLGALVDHHCTLAQHLAARIDADARLERLAPVALNIVCFRHRAPDGEDVDAFNARIVRTVQDSGVAVPSTTRVNGQLAIRVAIVNHRTTQGDVDRLLDTVLMAAQALLAR